MKVCLPVKEIKERNKRALRLPLRTRWGIEWASLIMKDGSLGPMRRGWFTAAPFLYRRVDAIGRIHFHPHENPEPSIEDKRSALLDFVPERMLGPEEYEPRLYAITSEETNSTIVYVFPSNFKSLLEPRLGKGIDLSIIFDQFVSEGVIKRYEFANTDDIWCVEIEELRWLRG
jgi:hypothetical protein